MGATPLTMDTRPDMLMCGAFPYPQMIVVENMVPPPSRTELHGVGQLLDNPIREELKGKSESYRFFYLVRALNISYGNHERGRPALSEETAYQICQNCRVDRDGHGGLGSKAPICTFRLAKILAKGGAVVNERTQSDVALTASILLTTGSGNAQDATPSKYPTHIRDRNWNSRPHGKLQKTERRTRRPLESDIMRGPPNIIYHGISIRDTGQVLQNNHEAEATGKGIDRVPSL